MYCTVESPLSQPRNILGGHIISCIIGVAITRLFVLDPTYEESLSNERFHPGVFVNGALSMSMAILVMFITGTLHPPGGATALIAAIEPSVIRLSWRYIPVIIVSAIIMFCWALIINNLGRRRYPLYWWSQESKFVVDQAPGQREDEELVIDTETENPIRQVEDGGRTDEALRLERLEGLERTISRQSDERGRARSYVVQ